MVSSRDIDRALGPEGRGTWVAVSQLIRPATHTVEAGTRAELAIDTLLHHKIGALPVVSNHELIGIVSESDFLASAVALLRPVTP
jgi:CBS domain-containing protein